MRIRAVDLAGLAGLAALTAGCLSPAGNQGTPSSGSSGSAASGTGSGATSGGSTGQASTGGVAGGTTGRSTSSGGTGGSTGRTASSTGGSTGSGTGGSSGGAVGDGGFDPGLPGPYTVGSTIGLSQTFATQVVPFNLYYPTNADGGPLTLTDGGIPAVLVSHGWLDTNASFTGWGTHLASWGFAVALPTWTNGMNDTDAAANAASANALLAWMDTEGASDTASPLYGLVDGKRHGLVGHSFGGLMVYVAASENTTVQAVVGLDPVDNGSTAATAVATIAGMGAMIPAQPALCDLGGNDQATVYANFPGQKLYAQVANAIHCDCQDPSGSCQNTCGAADPIRQMHFKRYATATLLWALECDARTLTWINGANIAADTGLSSTMNAAIACVP